MTANVKYCRTQHTILARASDTEQCSHERWVNGKERNASNPVSQAALFGFIDIPASELKRIRNEDLITHCRA